MYYTTRYLKTNKKKTIITYLTLEQKRQVMELTNEIGLVLLEFYLSKAGTPDYEYTDAKTAKALNWTIKKVGDNRRALQHANLYKTESDSLTVVVTLCQRFFPKKL